MFILFFLINKKYFDCKCPNFNPEISFKQETSFNENFDS